MQEMEKISFEELRELLDYWKDCRSDGEVPLRTDVDPIDIPQLLPHLCLVDVLDGGDDYKFRVVGTAVVDGIGEDWTGKTAREVEFDGRYPDVSDQYRKVVETRAPVWADNDMNINDRRLRFEILILPLSDENGQVTKILCGKRFANAFQF